jgi:hypothetical protein
MRNLIFIVSLTLLITFNSCGKKEDKPVSNDVKKEEKKTLENTPNTQDTKTGENDLGMKSGLPSNFPSDVPQPNNSKVLGHLFSSEGTVVTYESTDKIKDIIDFYKKEMEKNGFKTAEGGDILVSDQGGLMGWKKNNRDIGLMLGYDKDKNITSIVITYK